METQLGVLFVCFPSMMEDAFSIHLGLAWHRVLRWDNDITAFTLSSEAGSCGQGVLYLNGG